MSPLHAGPLEGMTVGRVTPGQASEVAAWLLSGLGAEVLQTEPPVSAFQPLRSSEVGPTKCRRADLVVAEGSGRSARPAGILRPAAIPCPTRGVPAGTLLYTTGVALATAAVAAWRAGVPVEVSELGVAIQIYLPQVMAASYGSPNWGAPPSPRQAPGGGWLSADLGADGDPERFGDLLAILPPDADAEAVAAAAQEWRLPVCDYRPRTYADPQIPFVITPAAADEQGSNLERTTSPILPPVADIAVCDLTAMWAGPLATWLLTRLGAVVHKVEPAVRLDGTRAIDGGGIYPGGVQSYPGEDSAMWNALNYWKDRAPFDLRFPDQRDQFVALASWCDVVIDSFSPRVMPNFGLNQRFVSEPGRPLLAGMPAFPEGSQRDWVAYGTGIHALLGLGDIGGGRFAAPSVTYPDPVAGFTGALAILAAVVGQDRNRPLERVEVPLFSATQPLQCFEPTDDVDHGDENPGAVLFDAGMAAGAFTALPVAGMQLMHPRGPFLPPTPAPELADDPTGEVQPAEGRPAEAEGTQPEAEGTQPEAEGTQPEAEGTQPEADSRPEADSPPEGPDGASEADGSQSDDGVVLG